MPDPLDCGHAEHVSRQQIDSCLASGGTVAVFVPGDPKPQGSKRPVRNQHSGRIQMVESSKHVKTWRGDIRDALLDPERQCSRLDGPVTVRLVFLMPRPRGHYRTGRNDHLLRDTAPGLPAGKPDIDKLARAVLDAIGSAGVWGDDSQVTDLDATKRYADRNQPTGVHITIEPDTRTDR